MKMSEAKVGTQVVDVGHMSVTGTVTKKTVEAIYVKWPHKDKSERWDVAHTEQFLEVLPVKNFTTAMVKGRMTSKSTRNVHSAPRSPTAKLSPAMLKALNEFDSAAMAWGWERDQGYGSQVDEAEKQYDKAKQELYDKILQLQQRLKTASKQKDSK